MNTISQLVYAIGVLDGVKGTLIFALIVLGMLVLVRLGAYVFAAVEGGYWDEEDLSHYRKTLRPLNAAMWAFPALLVLNVFIPSREVLLTIAASEVAEDAFKTEAGKTISGLAGKSAALLEKMMDDELRKRTPAPSED